MAISYNKVGWDTTKYFNPTNMNHMDDGIKAACDKSDANETAISNVSKKTDENAKAIEDANSNLKEHIVIVNGNIPYTCNAGGVININPCKNVEIPTGYTAVAIVGFSLNSPYMTMMNCIWANTNYGLYFRNDGNTEVSTNIGINVLCVKQC